MLSDATLSYGEDLTSALLGLDTLYASEQGMGQRGAGGDIERLVVLNMSTNTRTSGDLRRMLMLDRIR